MPIHSFHLAPMPPFATLGALLRAPTAPGLRHIEVLAGMELGSPVITPKRLQLRRVAAFAEWDDEESLERFLAEHPFGRRLARGWHVRLAFMRRWGSIRALDHLPRVAERTDPEAPVVAVTIARMRLLEVPRFLHWGRPVERQVRDHPGTTLSLAAMRPFRTISTFSIWRSAQAMTDMVFGHDSGHAARRHVDAMAERDRRDFHREFTTLRFRPLSEHGRWDGRSGFVPA